MGTVGVCTFDNFGGSRLDERQAATIKADIGTIGDKLRRGGCDRERERGNLTMMGRRERRENDGRTTRTSDLENVHRLRHM